MMGTQTRRWRSMTSRRVLVALVALLLCSGVVAAQKGIRWRMFSDALGSLWLYDWSGSPPDRPPTGGFLYIRDLTSTPRLVVGDSGTNDFNIPLFRDGIGEITSFPPNTPLMMDQDGFLAFKPTGGAYDGWLSVGADPGEFIWMDDTPVKWEGKIVGISNLDGTAGQLNVMTAPVQVALVTGVDLNVTTKTNLFTPAASQTWVVDYCIVRAASTSLTTAQFPFGSNANADDWLATDLYSELTTATKFTKVYPMEGAEVTTDTTPFGVKPTTAQGAAATVTIEVYAHRIS